jgi:hypothetical protein
MNVREPDQAARLVGLATRLDGARGDRWRGEFDVDRVAAIAADLSPAEAARLGNRLRAAGDAEAGIRCDDSCPPRCGVDRVPPASLGEVWDAPLYVWEHAGVFTTVTAVTVTPGLFLESGTHPAQMSWDRFGSQVIARGSTRGKPDLYAVFWLAESTGPYDGACWQWVTRELDADAMAAWSGLPLSLGSTGMPGGRSAAAQRLADWLSSLVNGGVDNT